MPKTIQDEQLILKTTTEAAEILGCKPSMLERGRVIGLQLPFIKIGANVRYRLSDLREFIERNQRTSTSDPGNKRRSGDA